MSEFPKKQGKRKQLFTERAVVRAGRACPDRIVRILRDGVIELVPAPGKGADTEPCDTSWDDLKDNAQK